MDNLSLSHASKYKTRTTHAFFARAFLSLVIAVALVFSCPVSAFAEVLAEDNIGGRTVNERGLTISQAPDIDANEALLVASDGTILYSRNTTESVSIASITKIMTAVVALENASPDDVITVADEAAAIGESSAGLAAGSQLTLLTLLNGLLIESGNDAAEAIAIGVGGSEAQFVQKMNEKATSLGMTNTHYANPHGLDQEGNYSCAQDLAILVRYAMKNETFRTIVGTAQEDIDLGNGVETITNTNILLTQMSGAIGVKTGTTDAAGYCLTAAANRDNLELYAIILGSSSESSRFDSAETLLEWGFAHYISVNLSDTSTLIASVPHSQWTDVTVPVACETAKSVYVLDYNDAICQDISVMDITGDVKKGDVLGTITWTQSGKVIATSRLIAAKDVAAPNLFEKLGVWFKRTFTASAETADLQVLVSPVEIPSPFVTE